MNGLKLFKSKVPFDLESGEKIDKFEIAYHTYGKPNEDGSNVVWVFHALSANSDVFEWWPGLFGEGCLFNPDDYFIICANTIGSPYGSSCPENLQFPQFTVRDVVRAHVLLANKLGINKIHTIIGGSFGGNQALEFTYLFNGKIDNMVLVASCAKESAWGIAVHESQRLALQSDPTFGTKGGGESGMKAARSMAMLTYRTSDTFIKEQSDHDEKTDDFRASSYLQYQGDKFVKRFNALCYYYLSKCLDSHNIGRDRDGEVNALQNIVVPTLIIGIKSDTLIPTRLQKFMAEHIPHAIYEEIDSTYGHDGFLKETEKISEKIRAFYAGRQKALKRSLRKVLKFGGSSLADSHSLANVVEIIKAEKARAPLAIVVSARGKSTDKLIEIYDLAKKGEVYKTELQEFIQYQTDLPVKVDLSQEFDELKKVLAALALLKTDEEFVYDKVISFGELISAKILTALLKENGLEGVFIDAREIIFTKALLDEFEVDLIKSKKATLTRFEKLAEEQIPVIMGYIACSEKGRTVTLGRNGSNYSATLIASFIGAAEVQNWTDVDGIYSANPRLVPNAIRINKLSYREANELANFGTNVLHPKTILPLMQSVVPLVIKNTKAPYASGTIIDKEGAEKGVKAVSVIEDVALVSIEGQGLSGSIGIDGRIFSALGGENISVRLIAQASSERGIGFVINKEDASRTEMLLNKVFEEELRLQDISSIRINTNIAVIAIVGRHNYSLEKAIKGLRKNKIWMHLISNSISGEHISLVIDNKHLKKAVRVVHNEVFGVIKTLHVFAFGKGNVGGELIDQIIQTPNKLIEERGLQIKVIGVADTEKYLITTDGLTKDWRKQLAASEQESNTERILQLLRNSGIENIVIADNTSSEDVSAQYLKMMRYGFDVVASNKKANSGSYDFYTRLRKEMKDRSRKFYYETNVGAGLPIIDTLKHLYQSSDQITKIRGVFSGSLSYLFNTFSEEELSFSKVLEQAKEKGFTEPDPREDLSGIDVARKLIILAREVGMAAGLEDVQIENLVPESLQELSDYRAFIHRKDELDLHFENIKSELNTHEVLRYVGELNTIAGTLRVSLETVDGSTALGRIRNADSLFEIYTVGYANQPIVVQGAGAGATVTARGVYSDLLRIGREV